jgi:RNA recognition motif-containing protein
MSTDYRPRGGGESTGGSGGRRRRGGRGRGQGHSHSHGSSTHTHGEARAHTNGTPKKKEGFLSKLIGIFKGKKKQPESKPARSESPARPEYKEREREPRAERPRREERPAKVEPTPQEITAPKLYVGNLAYEAAEGDLHDLFSKVGFVKSVEVATDRRTSRSKGFGFVEMDSVETAKAAAEKLNRTDFMGRQIVVSGAKLDKRPSREESAESSESSTESSDTPTQSETGSGESTI